MYGTVNRSRHPGVPVGMDDHIAFDINASTQRLLALAERCLVEAPSRRLDGEIYCAVHHIVDMNDLNTHNLWKARESGEVLVEHRGGAVEWIEVPPFTAELKYAETLLPERVATILKDPRLVCAAALRARAQSNAPPPYVSSLLEVRQG
jgi:hypothetical protein